MNDIDQRLRLVLADVLGVDSASVSELASPATIDTWDSLRHMSLIVALEEEFGITLDDDALDESTSYLGARACVVRLLDRAAA